LQKFNFNKTYFFFLRQIQLIPESKWNEPSLQLFD
jgi:hypothetical protein